MRVCHRDHFREGITKMGALGEAWVEGVSTSPSCQVYITPDGSVEIVSTHEQVRCALSVYERFAKLCPSCARYGQPVSIIEMNQSYD